MPPRFLTAGFPIVCTAGPRRVDQRRPRRRYSRLNAAGGPESVDVERSDVSEIADRRIAHPREVLSLEEEVRIVVLEADMRRQRLRLSIRQVESMESAANLRDFQERMKREQVDEPTGNALTDALRRAKLVN